MHLEDVAEALFLELTSRGFLKGAGRTLQFVVHSTGALVIRQLLAQYDWMNLHERVKDIVFVAPANNGSPLAHKGRSQLGRLKTMLVDGLIGGDKYVSGWQFGEVGKDILYDLELASPRQWELSDYDLLAPGKGTLYHSRGINAWVITGADDSTLTRLIADTDGTDGVIVTSGAGLNVRRLTLNVHYNNKASRNSHGWNNGVPNKKLPIVPQMIIRELDHSTILEDEEVANVIIDALLADTSGARTMVAKQMRLIEKRRNSGDVPRYQQFITRVHDDRGRAVVDYDLSFHVWRRTALNKLKLTPVLAEPLFPHRITSKQRIEASDPVLSSKLDAMLRASAHRHGRGHQYRRFLLNVDEIATLLTDDHVLTFTIVAYTGDKNVQYATEHVNDVVVHPQDHEGSPSLFFPDTTTQIDVTLDRFSKKGTVVAIKDEDELL